MDVASFISAIVSAAAGIYSVGLTRERSIDIDLTFQPNQIIRVSALSTSIALGSGTLTISRDSELTLSQLTVSVAIEVRAGALLTLQGVRFASEGCVKVEDEVDVDAALPGQADGVYPGGGGDDGGDEGGEVHAQVAAGRLRRAFASWVKDHE